MKIQKGIVKYKDRNDIVCFYGVTDDGRQYYFLDETDEKKFKNGNRIASKLLVEAIDPMVTASNIGVVDENGREVIPFDNKTIRPINDAVILVEKAKPVTQSVIAANELKKDPAFATQLVSTPATIKGNLASKMGPDGRYLFNDQFSEATVYDINGNNLINNEYFSFIGMTREKLFFSKNTVDSPITEYTILTPTASNTESSNINVSDFNVAQSVVENALNENNSQIGGDNQTDNGQSAIRDDVYIPSIGSDLENSNSGFAPIETEIPKVDLSYLGGASDNTLEEDTLKNINNDNLNSNIENNESLNEEAPLQEMRNEIFSNDNTFENNEENYAEEIFEESNEDFGEDEVEEEIFEDGSLNDNKVDEVTNNDDDDDETNIEENESNEALEDVEEQTPKKRDSIKKRSKNKEEETGFNYDRDEMEKEIDQLLEFSMDKEDKDYEMDLDMNEDIFKDSVFKVDNIEKNFPDSFDEEDYKNMGSEKKDTIMADVALSMTNLIRQNRDQKNVISRYQEKFEKIISTRRSIVDKVKIQEKKIEVLTNKIRSMEKAMTNLEKDYQILESKNRDQEKIIASQNHEIEDLRPQLAGKEDLVKVLADAQVLLEEDSYKYRDKYYEEVE